MVSATVGIHSGIPRFSCCRCLLIQHRILPGTCSATAITGAPLANDPLSITPELSSTDLIDVEIEDGNDQRLTEKVRTWINMVEERTGLRPVIYTSHYLYRTKFKGQFTGYKFWIANYNKQVDGLDDPSIIHWQFSEHGSIPGIEGDVDLNCSKINYN